MAAPTSPPTGIAAGRSGRAHRRSCSSPTTRRACTSRETSTGARCSRGSHGVWRRTRLRPTSVVLAQPPPASRPTPERESRSAVARRSAGSVLLDERLDPLAAQLRHAFQYVLDRPVPPRDSLQRLHLLTAEAAANLPGGDACHDRVGANVVGDNGISSDHGPVAPPHARAYARAAADPHVVADLDVAAAAR